MYRILDTFELTTKRMKVGLNNSFSRFIIVGVINTIVGTAIMLVLYNVFHLAIGFHQHQTMFLQVFSVVSKGVYPLKEHPEWKI